MPKIRNRMRGQRPAVVLGQQRDAQDHRHEGERHEGDERAELRGQRRHRGDAEAVDGQQQRDALQVAAERIEQPHRDAPHRTGGQHAGEVAVAPAAQQRRRAAPAPQVGDGEHRAQHQRGAEQDRPRHHREQRHRVRVQRDDRRRRPPCCPPGRCARTRAGCPPGRSADRSGPASASPSSADAGRGGVGLPVARSTARSSGARRWAA